MKLYHRFILFIFLFAAYLSGQQTIFEKFDLDPAGCDISSLPAADEKPKGYPAAPQPPGGFATYPITLTEPVDFFGEFQRVAKENNLLLPEEEKTYAWPDGRKLVVKGSNVRMLNAKGKKKGEWTFDYLTFNASLPGFVGYQNGTANYYDEKGERLLIPEGYSTVTPTLSGQFIVRNISGFGLLSGTGAVILETKFRKIAQQRKATTPWFQVTPFTGTPYVINAETGGRSDVNELLGYWWFLPNGYLATRKFVIRPDGKSLLWCDPEEKLTFSVPNANISLLSVHETAKPEEVYLVRLNGTLVNTIPFEHIYHISSNGLVVVGENIAAAGEKPMKRIAFYNKEGKRLTEAIYRRQSYNTEIWQQYLVAEGKGGAITLLDENAKQILPLRKGYRFKRDDATRILTITWKEGEVNYQQFLNAKKGKLTAPKTVSAPAVAPPKSVANDNIVRTEKNRYVITDTDGKPLTPAYDKIIPGPRSGTLVGSGYVKEGRNNNFVHHWLEADGTRVALETKDSILTDLNAINIIGNTWVISTPDRRQFLLRPGEEPSLLDYMIRKPRQKIRSLYVFNVKIKWPGERYGRYREGLIDAEGNVVLPPYYDMINPALYPDSHNRKYAPDNVAGDLLLMVNGRANLLKPDGTWRFELNKYADIRRLTNNHYAVGLPRERGGVSTWGVVDDDGKEIIPAVYEKVRLINGALYGYTPGRTSTAYDLNGEEIR